MIDAAPNPPTVIIVQSASNHQPYVFLGFIATGTSASLTCIEKLSTGPSLKSGRANGPNNMPEVMVAFVPGGSRQLQLQTYRSARSGVCQDAKIEVTVLPLEALKPGGGGLDRATVEDPAFIVEPKP